MKTNALTIALAVLMLVCISPIEARDVRSSSNGSSSSQTKSAASHSRQTASDRRSHKNSAGRARVQKKEKNVRAKSRRNPPDPAPEIIEEQKVDLPSRDDTDDVDDNGPDLIPDTGLPPNS